MAKKLQIVRVDNDLVQKANLQIGNNIIGRGAVTGCNDDHVLKHALTINLSPNDEMTITPVVPCYMKSAGCIRWQSLKLGNSVLIKPGDVCSLLPDKCWFKIISTPGAMENNQTLKRKADKDPNNEVDSKKTCLSSSMETIVSPSETLNDILNIKVSSNYQNCLNNESSEHNNAPVLQEIYSASSPEENGVSPTCSKILPDSQDITESSVEHKSEEEQKAKNINLINKPTTCIESGEKIKLDCDAQGYDQTDQTVSPIKNDSPSVVAQDQDQASVSDPKIPAVPKREQCMYGARCYRKNPNHRNNYSHPGEPDYDELDDREECPYGLKCYRKNAQHKAQFKHTKVPRRRRVSTPVHSVADNATSETNASSAEESIDESDYEPSVYTESSDTRSEWDSTSEWEDGTTG